MLYLVLETFSWDGAIYEAGSVIGDGIDGGVLAAWAASRLIRAYSSGGSVTVADREPSNGTQTAGTIGTSHAAGGSFTLVLNGTETAPIAWSATLDGVRAVCEAVLGTGCLDSLYWTAGGDFTSDVMGFAFTMALGPVTIEIGQDLLTGGEQANGSCASVQLSGLWSQPDLAPTGTLWLDTDDSHLFANYGSDTSPNWQTATGPQGDMGPAGADGAPGPAGADGAPGPAGADGMVGDSRLHLMLNYSQSAMQTFPQNTDVPLTWGVRGSAGSDVSLDADTKTLRFATEGTYLLRLRWGMSSGTADSTSVRLVWNGAANPPISGLIGGDAIQSSIPLTIQPDGTTTWVLHMAAGGAGVLTALVGGGSGDAQGYDISLDIVRIAPGPQGPQGEPGSVPVAAYVDPASETFASDLVAALIASGLMEGAPA